ncbi:MAG: hypothetical protein K1X68_01445 [Saprospiraceae bacterium]|nr:hypothetical protein [Saprospiraceae bacterium]HMW40044.1 hypothetical protein [Saprospiraceae bacterium]HMX89162.1 hypothetical protein [Saprospiraceae bacterium]HMZ40777.1 hypothetical protein [Saprospiraceae bacterium]HNA65620.1 hypothetical protein [Saprospiraceae bacterium]
MGEIFDNPQAVAVDRLGNRIDESTFFVRTPLVENGTLRICSNFGIIANAGNSLLIIDDNFTLQPGGTLNFGSQHNPSMFIKNLNIRFKANPAVTDPQVNKLEWIEYIFNGMDQVFYKARGKNS